MKEKIYTIPVNEAYEIDCECPLCELEKKLEEEAVEYALGPAMMEPDFRTESNEKGYCTNHFKMMFAIPGKLPLALVLDTHLDEVSEKINNISQSVQNSDNKKRGLIKRNTTPDASQALSDLLEKLNSDCMVCKKVNYTMERYADVLMQMWVTDKDFKDKFDRSKGVCLKHLKLLSDTSKKSLKEKDRNDFMAALLSKETKELSRIKDDIHRFTLKFDHRNQNMEWGTAKDAPLRTIEKLSGYID